MIYLLWFLGDFYFPSFMTENFLVSWELLKQGRVWTILTSVFSHNMFFHLFINMFVFFGFGMGLEKLMGRYKFLLFYLSAGIFASLGHCFVSAFILHESALPALGASGAIAGVIIFFSLLFPKEKLLILGIIPIPAIFGALLIVGMDVWGLFAQTRGSTLPIGYGAHLGGAIYGAIYFLYLRFLRPKFSL